MSVPIRIRIVLNTSKIKMWNMSKMFLLFITILLYIAKKYHFFSALTLGLKKDDMGFMPVLSTLARVFWAADIFFGGWNREMKRDKVNIWQPWGQQSTDTNLKLQSELEKNEHEVPTKYPLTHIKPSDYV